MNAMWTTTSSPVGELRIVANGGAITAVDFLEPVTAPSGRSSVAHATARSDGRPLGPRDDRDPLLRSAVEQLREYFAGERTSFDLPLAPDGTEFQQRVWKELREIDYGEVTTYGEIARRLGMTGHGSRAVGLANGRNPIPILIPCHRVVGADGSLTGYGGGVERKQKLLDLEQDALF
jgi:methylated-DNA-[protein]-cysteine S-methyltransferase